MTHPVRETCRALLTSLCLCASVPLRCLVVRSIVIAFGLAVGNPIAFAQDAAKPAQSSGPTSADELALEQSRVADKYAKLEQLMLKMSELEGLTNPKRAQLLIRAVEQSKEKLTRTQLDSLVK